MSVWSSNVQSWLQQGRWIVVVAAFLGTSVQAANHPTLALQAQRQLERARDAARRLDYSGVVMHQQGPQSDNYRIAHQADANEGVVRIEPLDGPPRHMLQRGRQLTWYLTQERVVVHDEPTGVRSFPALSLSSARELLVHYRPRSLATDRVAGRQAELLQLQPVDGLRYGYRLWFDTITGLLLRAQSISETGQVVAQTSFSQLSVWAAGGGKSRWREPDVRAWKTEYAVKGKADLSGWSFRLPEGFSQVAAWRRSMGALQGAHDGSRELVQIVCSDGLAGLSIFIEPWSEARSTQPVQRGAVNMLGKRLGGFWLTIVGETPMAALRQVADSLVFTAPHSNNSP
ncbi:MAG: MucB/RseB C-terminal domain-containing protein [Oxalobacteraceae bacterium]